MPLNCGKVSTKANLYVRSHIPFELLLGQPWQRGNYVSIDKRKNRTYLLFKDLENLEPRYEILVAMEKKIPSVGFNEYSVWNLKESPASYFISVDQQQKEEAKDSQEIEPKTGPTRDLRRTSFQIGTSTLLIMTRAGATNLKEKEMGADNMEEEGEYCVDLNMLNSFFLCYKKV